MCTCHPSRRGATRCDQRTDIFALGAVLYELIGGRRAFTGDTQADVLSAVIKDEPPLLSELGGRGFRGRSIGSSADVSRRTATSGFERRTTSRLRSTRCRGSVSGVGARPPARQRWLLPLAAGVALGSLVFGAAWLVAGAGSARALVDSLRGVTSPPR